MSIDANKVVSVIESILDAGNRPIGLHEPVLGDKEIEYLQACIQSGYVSSVGDFIRQFEESLQIYTGAKYAIASVNGTEALHIALLTAGVTRDTEVLIPSLSFVATANAVTYCGARPHFCDVDEMTLGLDPVKLEIYLSDIVEVRDDGCWNRLTGKKISALVPMHTFGFPAEMNQIIAVNKKFLIPIVEDAAESLGTFYRKCHTGTIGLLGILSFNGNKIITSGGGGAILTNDSELAGMVRHLTTTAKVSHEWNYQHDMVGFNFRMPNINAALGLAQLEKLPEFLEKKQLLAKRYQAALEELNGVSLFITPEYVTANNWLNTMLLDEPDRVQLDELLKEFHSRGIKARPAWNALDSLPMYSTCPKMDLSVTERLCSRIINLPSSAGL